MHNHNDIMKWILAEFLERSGFEITPVVKQPCITVKQYMYIVHSIQVHSIQVQSESRLFL